MMNNENGPCPRGCGFLSESSVSTSRCVSCGGVLVDVGKTANESLKEIPKLVPNATPSSLVCPKSNVPMSEITIQGVVVDYSVKSNLLWLDSGELLKLNDLYNGVKGKGYLEKTSHWGSSNTSALEIVGEVAVSLLFGVFD